MICRFSDFAAADVQSNLPFFRARRSPGQGLDYDPSINSMVFFASCSGISLMMKKFVFGSVSCGWPVAR